MKTIENNSSEVTQTDTERLPPVPPTPSSRWLLVGLAAAALVFGIVIYSGVHERAQAESTLGVRTESMLFSHRQVLFPRRSYCPATHRRSTIRPSMPVLTAISNVGTKTSVHT
jgi:hypothetical protein